MTGKKTLLIFSLLSLQIFVSFFIWAALIDKIATTKIITNTYISGVAVQGLTYEQAKQALQKRYPHPFDRTIFLTAGGNQLAVNLKEIGAEYLYLEALAGSFGRPREKSGLAGLNQTLKELIRGPRINLPVRVNEDLLAEKINELNRMYFKEPVNAVLNWQDGRPVVTPEEYGKAIDIKGTLAKFSELKVPLPDQFEAVVSVIKPAVQAKELAEFKYVLGAYETIYAPNELARAHNIKTAAAAIDNTIIRPGQVFSFNETVGERTKENGYQKAPVIKASRMEIDYGGGICQVSTTLYNAALMAGLEIIERHPHARAVPYVQRGMDAAVANNTLDLKLKNNLSASVYLSCRAENGRLSVKILGKIPPRKIK